MSLKYRGRIGKHTGLCGALTIAVGTPSIAQVCSDPNTTCLFANSVPTVCGWDQEGQAEGHPSTSDCNDSSLPYAVQSNDFIPWNGSGAGSCDNNGGACSADFACSCEFAEDCECFLEATQFGTYTLPPGRAIKAVYADVQCRYNHQTAQCGPDAGRVRVRVQLPSLSRSTVIELPSQFSNGLNDDDCKYRLSAQSVANITNDANLNIGVWTAALINDLQVAVRRVMDGGSNTALRVNAFRIAVADCSDCDGNGVCDFCDGQPNGTPCAFDSNVCTDDRCVNGCCMPINSIAPCDDGIFCNGVDTCSNGACQHAGNPCAGGPVCANACNETADNCFDAAGVACTNDNNPCTNDVCTGTGFCTHPNAPDGTGCNDDMFCNGADTCTNGACGHTGNPCSGGSECADSCNEASDNCFDPTDAECTSDGNACTNDVCDGSGLCTHPNAPNGTGCNDDDSCTTGDVCSGGACAGSPMECDDGFFCNGIEKCMHGVCVDGEEPDCKDDVECTTDFCDEATHGFVCHHLPDDALCGPGQTCRPRLGCRPICLDVIPPVIVHNAGHPGSTRPCSGYIDPRIESSDGIALDRGVNSVDIQFSEPVYKIGGDEVDATSFVVTETGNGAPPGVLSVVQLGDTAYRVKLTRFIALQEWTTIRAIVEDDCGNPILNTGPGGPTDEPDRVDVAGLPGDVNQNGATKTGRLDSSAAGICGWDPRTLRASVTLFRHRPEQRSVTTGRPNPFQADCRRHRSDYHDLARKELECRSPVAGLSPGA